MIIIRTIEELKAERERQLKEWLDAEKENDVKYFCLNLSGADFRGSYLRGCNFAPVCNFSPTGFGRVNLTGANFQGADLRGTFFANADFTKANLSGANLIGSDLRCCIFNNAELIEVDLRWANLSGADFRGAYLVNIDFSEANLEEAQFSKGGKKKTVITRSQFLAIIENFMVGFEVK